MYLPFDSSTVYSPFIFMLRSLTASHDSRDPRSDHIPLAGPERLENPNCNDPPAIHRPFLGFRLTGFRLSILLISNIGTVKAMLSYLGQTTAPTTVELMFGVVAMMILTGIWWRKEDVDDDRGVHSQFYVLMFEKDYGEVLLATFRYLWKHLSQLSQYIVTLPRVRTRFSRYHNKREPTMEFTRQSEQISVTTGFNLVPPNFEYNLRRRSQPPITITPVTGVHPVNIASEEILDFSVSDNSSNQSLGTENGFRTDATSHTIEISINHEHQSSGSLKGTAAETENTSPLVLEPSADRDISNEDEADVTDIPLLPSGEVPTPSASHLSTDAEPAKFVLCSKIRSLTEKYYSTSNAKWLPANELGCALMELFSLEQDKSTLDDAITYLQEAANLLNYDSSNPSRAKVCYDLAVALTCRNRVFGGNSKEDIDSIISILERVEIYERERSDSMWLTCILSEAYIDRFAMTDGNVDMSGQDDLEKAISGLQEWETFAKERNERIPQRLRLSLINALTCRYELEHSNSDFVAITGSEVLIGEDVDVNRSTLMLMARAYTTHFKESGDPSSAKHAYLCLTKIRDHPDFRDQLRELGSHYLRFYLDGQNGQYVQMALFVLEQTVDHVSTTDLTNRSCLIDLSVAYTLNGDFDKALSVASKAVKSDETIVGGDLYYRLHCGLICSILHDIGMKWECRDRCECPLRHLLGQAKLISDNDTFGSLNELAIRMSERIPEIRQREDEIADWLAGFQVSDWRAIFIMDVIVELLGIANADLRQVLEQWVIKLPAPCTLKLSWIESLNISSMKDFQRFKQDLAVLDESILTLQEVTKRDPDSHPDKSSNLNSLGDLLLRRFEQLGDRSDLKMSFLKFQEALQLAPDGHLSKQMMLDNLDYARDLLYPLRSQTVKPEFEPSSFYALIIGNENYPYRIGSYSLKGAGNDARKFKKFLSESLKVPDDNVKLLLDATRDDMISTFKEMQSGKLLTKCGNNTPIPKGSIFVLYYAGHGGHTKIPKEWTSICATDRRVDLLIPSDVGKKNKSGVVTEGIPEHTIAAALEELVRKIGDNVIVILDCCYSGGLTRVDKDTGTVLTRHLPNLPPFGGSCSEDVVSSGKTGIGLSRVMRSGIEVYRGDKNPSYILLTACQQSQIACDIKHGGLFTTKLLDVLYSEPLNLLTYAGLILKTKMPGFQTPGCYGYNQNRIIFTTKEGVQTDKCFIGDFYKHWVSNNSFDVGTRVTPIVYGGLAHGIREGDTFNLFDITQKQKQIGGAKAVRVYSSYARLSITSTISEGAPNISHVPFYCQLIRNYTSMKIFFTSSQKNLLSRINTEKITFSQAFSLDEAIVIITDDKRRSSNVELSFRSGCIENENIFKDGVGNRFMDTIRKDRPSEIRAVLISMFQFYNLLNTRQNIPKGWENIDVKFFRVKGGSDETVEDGIMTRHPDYDSFCHSMKGQSDVTTVIARGAWEDENMDLYGLSITNNTEEYLFAYVLLLDPGEMRIDPWYLSTFHAPDIPFHRFAGAGEKPKVADGIRPGETLSIGYGNSGVDPISFFINNGSEEYHTYFKIILTTFPTDFSMFIQAHNPLHAPPRQHINTTSSNTARGNEVNLECSREDLLRMAGREQKIKREDKPYYSVNFTVHQILE